MRPYHSPMELSPRKRDILRRVVEEHVATGRPVGSKWIVERTELEVSSSTVRNELAELEALGLLTHPHTSAGRVPTDSGYRVYTEELVGRVEGRPAPFTVDLTAMRSELEEALRRTTEALSDATHLLALVSAPPIEAAAVRHVEVLQLQPGVVLVVVITASGDVSKRVFELEHAGRPGARRVGPCLSQRDRRRPAARRRSAPPPARGSDALGDGAAVPRHDPPCVRRRAPAGRAALRRRRGRVARRRARHRARGVPAPARRARAPRRRARAPLGRARPTAHGRPRRARARRRRAA